MTTKPDRTRQLVRTAFDRLDAIQDEHRAARGQIQKDPHLSAQGRADKLAKLDADTDARIAKQQRATIEAIADHNAALVLTSTPRELPGVEGVAARIEAADARARVRGLLSAGTEPAKIIDRAVATSDLTVLDALRAEAQWMNLNDPRHVTGPAPGAPDALLTAIDQARAGLLPEDQGAALLELGEFTAQRDALLARANRAALGSSTSSFEGAVADRQAGLTSPGGILAPEVDATTTEGALPSGTADGGA